MSKSMENLVKEISGLTVLELAELTKALEAAFGVSAAMPLAAGSAAVASAEAAPAGKKEEEKTEYKVELIDAGANKMNVIKALRQIKKDLGLIEVKKMTEEVPAVIAEAASKEEAKVMKETLEAAGAKVKLS